LGDEVALGSVEHDLERENDGEGDVDDHRDRTLEG
jgi:hypothetical protein